MDMIRDSIALDTRAFIMFSDLIKQFYDRKASKLEALQIKNSHLRILHLLSDHNGINQQEIADIACSKRSTISELISEMEKEGLVKRVGNEQDRRVMNIHLTQKGSTSADVIQVEFRAYCMECMRDFTTAEVMIFQDLLNKFQFRSH